MRRREDDHCYAAFAECGCLAAVIVEEPMVGESTEGHRQWVARFLAEQARDGYRIEHLSIPQYDSLKPWCEAHPNGTRWDKRPKVEQDGLGL